VASEIFFVPVNDVTDGKRVADAVGRLADAAGLGEVVGADLMYMLKVHFGERGNNTYIPAPWLRPIVDRVKDAGSRIFVSDTNTLYVGSRSNAVDHLMLAHEHGFTHDVLGAPVIIADGLVGENQSPVEVDLKHYRQVYLANDARASDGFVVATNVTGHILSGLGGAIKNIGMGVAGRGGKRSQHCDLKPRVIKKKCTSCGTCARWCPADAITVDGHAVIDEAKCIGCGECYAVCRYGAIDFSWSETSSNIQEKMAEHCHGALKGKKGESIFFNFLTAVTKNCNCMGKTEKPVVPPIGIIAGTDIVAVDQASIDLVDRAAGDGFFASLWPDWDCTLQIVYGESIGLGSREYELTEVS
jgi:uncharacterized Fe-S center protein